MKVAVQCLAGGIARAAFAALAGLALASCTATDGPQLTSSAPAYSVPAGDQAVSLAETDTSAVASSTAGAPMAGAVGSVAQPEAAALSPGDTLSPDDTMLPEQVAFLPVAKPADAPALDALSGEIEAAPAAAVAPKPAFAAATRSGTRPVVMTASIAPAKAVVELSSRGQRPALIKASFGDALPGVRPSALFEIKRKSGIDDDSDVDLHEDEAPDARQIASAGSLARLDPNGLLLQRDTVDVACLKPDLMRMLKTVEHHYGRKLVVTSGYRNPTFNHKVGGARNSMHMYCAAADVQMPGVGKWELAQYVRSMPGRGGVGTYCHTESIHVDIGPERDWNWRCRRRKA